MSEISRSVKSLARDLDITVIALSQLNRAVENRNNKRPLMSDLRESGALEQDADLVAFVYRDEYYNETPENKGLAEVNIAKHRNGKTGKVKLHFASNIIKFENLARFLIVRNFFNLFFDNILAIFQKKCDFRAVPRSAFCRSRRELSNEHFLAKFRFDTAENEPCKVRMVRSLAYRTFKPRFAAQPSTHCCTWARPAPSRSWRASPRRSTTSDARPCARLA